jgi:peptidoglycan/xylan/chitin deacetylase (PgdA/CDA1 family)
MTSAAFDTVRKPPAGLVVLIYHRVGRRSAIEVDLPRAAFADQMAFLAAETTVVTLADGLARLADPATAQAGERLVAVTFDDGTADFADEAVPVLVERGVPVTLYVATEFLDEGRPFPDDGVPLSWAALADAASSGVVDVGSHTHSHALLDRLPAAQIAGELDRSIELIAEHVGRAPQHFAYPKAVMGSPAADAAIRDRFASAAVAGTRVNEYGRTDPYRLARSPIQVSDGMRWFEAKTRGGLAFEDTLRRTINKARYRSKTT